MYSNVLRIDEIKNNQQRTITSSSSSYSSYCRHGAGSVVGEAIAQAFQEEICPFMSASVMNFISDLLKHGTAEEDIIGAIRVTGEAPRPSFAYFRVVIQDWIRRGYVDYEE